MWRAPVFFGVAALAALAAVIGLLLGWRMVTTTETDVINRVAARYLAEEAGSAQATDCVARPAASSGLWLVVICESAAGTRHEYFINRYGRIADVNRVEAQG